MSSVSDPSPPPYAYPPRPDWLSLSPEIPLDPNLAIVDAHHHFSDRRGHVYMLDELEEDVFSGHRVVATVFVEGRMCDCGCDEGARGVAETGVAMALGTLAEARGERGVAAGIVGNVALSSGARIEETLQAHLLAGMGRFRGVRQIAPWDPSPVLRPLPTMAPDILADRTFREGFAKLAPLGLSFDAWLYYPQFSSLKGLADAFPDTQIILDFPIPLGVGDYSLESPDDLGRWRDAVRSVASCPNIAVKLGGFGMGITGLRLGEQAAPPSSPELCELMRPYVEFTIQSFGVERCLVGSNFPVDKGSFSYMVFWNAFKRLLSTFSEAEREAILSLNASRFYRLSVD
jgi:predicted TIM-barrel fold metal-dependent hydrolase